MPIFSSQILSRYENLSYKGLKMQGDPGFEKPAICKPEKGLTGIASSYKKETADSVSEDKVDF